jgi:ribosomal protein S1
VKGKVLKVNPFGLFVELDKDIHGLAHISAMNGKNPSEIAPGAELEFTIITIEPKEHRLGLSLGEPKAQESKETKKQKSAEEKEATPSAIPAASPATCPAEPWRSGKLEEQSGEAGIQEPEAENKE